MGFLDFLSSVFLKKEPSPSTFVKRQQQAPLQYPNNNQSRHSDMYAYQNQNTNEMNAYQLNWTYEEPKQHQQPPQNGQHYYEQNPNDQTPYFQYLPSYYDPEPPIPSAEPSRCNACPQIAARIQQLEDRIQTSWQNNRELWKQLNQIQKEKIQMEASVNKESLNPYRIVKNDRLKRVTLPFCSSADIPDDIKNDPRSWDDNYANQPNVTSVRIPSKPDMSHPKKSGVHPLNNNSKPPQNMPNNPVQKPQNYYKPPHVIWDNQRKLWMDVNNPRADFAEPSQQQFLALLATQAAEKKWNEFVQRTSSGTQSVEPNCSNQMTGQFPPTPMASMSSNSRFNYEVDASHTFQSHYSEDV
jgi:hypothetical protein